MRAIALSLFTLVATSSFAFAQDIYGVEDDVIEDDEVYMENHVADDEENVTVGPRVYGWTALRPDNCGTFKYWNGDYCADARYDPSDDRAD